MSIELGLPHGRSASIFGVPMPVLFFVMRDVG